MKNYKQTDLFQDDEALTLSVEDTRVSRFPLPDVKKAKKIRDTSGRNILDSLKNSVQVTSLERTWADIFDSVWIPYSKIWTARTTPLGALVLKQRVSVPRTDAKESSGLRFPTPRASDVEGGIVEDVELNNGSFSRRNKKGERWGVKLRDAANYLDKKEKEEPGLFPTPNTQDHKTNRGEHIEQWKKRAEKKKEEGINLHFALRHAVQMWPTPQAMDGMRSGQIRKREELSEAAKKGGCSNLREAVHDPKYLEQNIWPTPRVSSANGPSQREINEGNPKRRLETEVAIQNMLPTPTARDWKSGEASENTHQRNSRPLNEKVIRDHKTEQKKSEEKLHLNPTWVEGMMGFPHGWTDLGNEESPE